MREALSDLKVDLRIYVPGYPITDAIPALGEEASMATNEKVAMEVALGASVTGRRSIVLVKHLGVNILSDPLSISPTHTIGAGLVVLAGEDVGPKGSQAEMDVRNYGPLCEIPVLDPWSPDLLGQALSEAFDLSERIGSPAMVRTTFEFGDGSGSSSPAFAETGKEERSEKASRPGTFDRSIWNLTAKGRHQRYRGEVLPLLTSASASTTLNLQRDGEGDLGIIASGRPASLALNLEKRYPVLVAGYSHPSQGTRYGSSPEVTRRFSSSRSPPPSSRPGSRSAKTSSGR